MLAGVLGKGVHILDTEGQGADDVDQVRVVSLGSGAQGRDQRSFSSNTLIALYRRVSQVNVSASMRSPSPLASMLLSPSATSAAVDLGGGWGYLVSEVGRGVSNFKIFSLARPVDQILDRSGPRQLVQAQAKYVSPLRDCVHALMRRADPPGLGNCRAELDEGEDDQEADGECESSQ